MQRTRPWRQAQRQRWIKRRLFVVDNVWSSGYQPVPGKLDHSNLTCRPRCGLCHPDKRWPMPEYTRQRYGLWRAMQRGGGDWG